MLYGKVQRWSLLGNGMKFAFKDMTSYDGKGGRFSIFTLDMSEYWNIIQTSLYHKP